MSATAPDTSSVAHIPSYTELSGSQPEDEPLPKHITAKKDPATGKTYYSNSDTRTISWFHPSKKFFTEGLPWPWERLYDAKGRAYYLNHEKRSGSWLDPVKVEKFAKDGVLEGDIYKGTDGADCLVEEKTQDGKVYHVNYTRGGVGEPD